jgi:hypothetical protein
MPELEQNIENRIVKYVEGLGGFALKLVLASERGFPDRTLLLPGGLVIFVEVKRPKDSKTYHQQLVWQSRLQKRGFTCEFVSSMKEVAALIKKNIQNDPHLQATLSPSPNE